jgi:hypothetical protein
MDTSHCEERSDEAISIPRRRDRFAALATTVGSMAAAVQVTGYNRR